jgi:DNA-binding MarR family transcriptional regulator
MRPAALQPSALDGQTCEADFRCMAIDIDEVARRCICLHTRMAARAVTRAYNAALKGTGLEVTEFTLLAALSADEAPSISVLAEQLAFERTTLVRNLKALVDKGLVEPRKGAGRAMRHVVTPEGRQLLELGLPLWQETQTRLEGALDGDAGWTATRRKLRAVRKAAAVS